MLIFIGFKKMYMQNKYNFTIIIEKDSDGYFVYCPQLQGCYSQGDTYEEALNNIEDAIKLHIEDRQEELKTWKQPQFINVTSLELAI